MEMEIHRGTRSTNTTENKKQDIQQNVNMLNQRHNDGIPFATTNSYVRIPDIANSYGIKILSI